MKPSAEVKVTTVWPHWPWV